VIAEKTPTLHLSKFTKMTAINKYIDHTLLKATATENDIIKLCKEAIEYQFYAVCVNSCYVKLAKRELGISKVEICSVVGFPLGATDTSSKVYETKQALADGADEIDMVMNIGLFKSGQYEEVLEEIRKIKSETGNKILKVILETCYITNSEITHACELAVQAGADFVKTSTGFGSEGATKEAVNIMKDAVNNKCKIKASGGIRDKATALKYIKLGVSRIGTSSGITIMQEE
jgi:deoxyribose-phosphate aldolase